VDIEIGDLQGIQNVLVTLELISSQEYKTFGLRSCRSSRQGKAKDLFDIPLIRKIYFIVMALKLHCSGAILV
jgi:hypothetical protein